MKLPFTTNLLVHLFLFIMYQAISSTGSAQGLPGNSCADAIEIQVADSIIHTTPDFTGMSSELSGCGVKTSRQKVWYKFTPRTSRTYLTAYSTDAFIEIFQTCDTASRIFCKKYTSRVTDYLTLTSNQVYYLRISKTPSVATTNFGLSTVIENDNCADALLLEPYEKTGSYTHVNFANANPTTNLSTCHTSFEDIWYKIKVTEPWVEVVYTIPAGAGGIALYDSCKAASPRFCSQGMWPTDTVIFTNLKKGQTYLLRLIRRLGSLDTESQVMSFYYKNLTPPANDSCKYAIPLTVKDSEYVMTKGSLLGATGDDKSFPDRVHVWYSFVPTSRYVSLQSVSYDINAPKFELLDDCIDATPTGFNGIQPVTPGKKYYIRAYHATYYMMKNASFSLGVMEYPGPVNDVCSTATNLIPSAGAPQYTPFNMKNAGMEKPYCNVTSAYDIWYKFIASGSSSTIRLRQESNTNAVYSVWSDCNMTSLYCRKSDTSFTFPTTQGEDYYVSVNIYSSEFSADRLGRIAILSNPDISNLNCSSATLIQANTNSCVKTTINFDHVPSNTSAKEVWYKFIPSDSTQIIDVERSNTASQFYLYSNCSYTTVPLLHQDYSGLYNFKIRASRLTPGATYYFCIRTTDATGSSQVASFCIHGPSALNDECSQALELKPDCSSGGQIDLFTASRSSNKSCTSVNFQSDVWFKFTTPASSSVYEKFVLQLESINYYSLSGMNFQNYLLEVLDSCKHVLPNCIKAGNQIMSQSNYSRSLEYVISNLNPGKTYYLRLMQVNLGSSPYRITSEFFVKLMRSQHSGDFYNTSYNIPFNDKACFKFNYCNSSARSSEETINNQSFIVEGYEDQWITFEAKTRNVRFVMDNHLYYELYPAFGSGFNTIPVKLNEFYTTPGKDTIVYHHAVLDSGQYYKLRMAKRNNYDYIASSNDRVCIQYLPYNLKNSCTVPEEINGLTDHIPVYFNTVPDKPNDCNSVLSKSETWYTFTPASDRVIISFYNLPSNLEAALYYSCDSLLECFSIISEGNPLTIELTAGHTYIWKLYSKNAGIRAVTYFKLEQGVISSGNVKRVEEQYSVFPVPATDRLYVKGYEEGAKAELHNLQGLKVRSTEIFEGAINIADMPPGYYFLNINGYRHKIIILEAK